MPVRPLVRGPAWQPPRHPQESSMSLRLILSSLALCLGLAALPASAQTPAAPTTTEASAAQASVPAAIAPAAVPAKPANGKAAEVVDNPYGLEALWKAGDFIAKGVLIIMVIMSMA